jgi:hypothetical protein
MPCRRLPACSARIHLNDLQKSSWAEPAVDHGSVYRLALANYLKLRDGQSKRRDLPGADKVARVVTKLAACDHMPLRVRFGLDARLLSLVREILPTSLLLALKHRIFRPWLCVRRQTDLGRCWSVLLGRAPTQSWPKRRPGSGQATLATVCLARCQPYSRSASGVATGAAQK